MAESTDKQHRQQSAAFNDRGFKAVLGSIGTKPILIRHQDAPPGSRVVELASATALRIGAYRLMQHDLDEAEQSLNAIRSLRLLTSSDDGQPGYRAMLRAMCAAFTVIYCRCFKAPSSAGEKLVATDVFKDPIALGEHEFIATLRSKHFAHDVNDYRQAKVAATFSPEGELIDLPAFETFADRSDVIEHNGPLLVAQARQYLSAELETLFASLRAEIEAMTKEERLALPSMIYQPADHRAPQRSRSGQSRSKSAK